MRRGNDVTLFATGDSLRFDTPARTRTPARSMLLGGMVDVIDVH